MGVCLGVCTQVGVCKLRCTGGMVMVKAETGMGPMSSLLPGLVGLWLGFKE